MVLAGLIVAGGVYYIYSKYRVTKIENSKPKSSLEDENIYRDGEEVLNSMKSKNSGGTTTQDFLMPDYLEQGL
jgi:hypothetical protein